MLVDILSRETVLQVKEVEQGDTPLPGVIYVVPANSHALLREGRLTLVAATPEVVPKPSINQFLISLAAEQGEAAVGVILSGTGSDGVAGMRAIQAAGGHTFVQLPSTAKYDGMPRAAIDAGVADNILAPEDIAARLHKLMLPTASEAGVASQGMLDSLLSRLRESLQFDFSGYKIGTLMRRINRRIIATSSSDLASYLALIEAQPAELDLLARDILISSRHFSGIGSGCRNTEGSGG